MPSDSLLVFERLTARTRLNTHIVLVKLSESHALIGSIAWHQPYRQYTFKPEPDVIYTEPIISEIVGHLKSMMRAWAKYGPREAYEKGDYRKA